MLQALKRMFGQKPRDPAQLALDLAVPVQTSEDLFARLTAFGLTGFAGCTLTRNRSVMVSSKGTQLRIHEGYLAAPDNVLQALVVFFTARRRSQRLVAKQIILAYPVQRGKAASVARTEQTHPDDAPMVAKLREWHASLNQQHFAGMLKEIDLRISRRMKRRLGHYAPGDGLERVPEIVISRRHIRRHGWKDAHETLLHEMVHQWQHETGVPIDHGRGFRQKARQVGITPAATRASSA